MGEERGEILDLEGILGAFSLYDNMSVKSRQSVRHCCEQRLRRAPRNVMLTAGIFSHRGASVYSHVSRGQGMM